LCRRRKAGIHLRAGLGRLRQSETLKLYVIEWIPRIYRMTAARTVEVAGAIKRIGVTQIQRISADDHTERNSAANFEYST